MKRDCSYKVSPGDAVERRGFARAIGPDEADDGILRQLEIHVLQHPVSGKGEADAGEFEEHAAYRATLRRGQMPLGRNSIISSRNTAKTSRRRSPAPRSSPRLAQMDRNGFSTY